jgi:hypothetical protein
MSGSPEIAATGSDPSWKGLYRIGSVSATLFVVLNIMALVLDLTAPPPISGGAATLRFIAENRTIYILEQALWLVPGVFAMIAFLALYVALKDLNKSYAALGALIGGAAWALTLAIPTTSRGAHALVYLSDRYAAATTDAERAAFATAAEAIVAQNNTPTVAGILTTVGVLIVSLVMLKGVFHKGVAYLGIATGVLGVASEALRFVLPAGYAVYGLLLFVWFIAVGWQLYKLARDPEKARAHRGTRQRSER